MAPSTKRSILITGCSDGSLGIVLALAFRDAGWRVFASARNLAKTKTATQADLEVIQLDTLKQESIDAAVAEVSKLTGGSLDMLLNNAGAGYGMPVLDLEWDKVKELFELNFFSIITVTKGFLPLLRNSQTVHGGVRGGIVVNNTSGSSLWVGALPWAAAYNASKAAATSLTENMRLELAPFGIKVVNLMTGGVKSTFYENATKTEVPADSLYAFAKDRIDQNISGVDFQDRGDPEEYARTVAKKLSKSNPPHWVWAGKSSRLVWLATFMPVGFIDGAVKQMTGLNDVERLLK
ncbi:IBR finger domain protein [Lophiotrema nucula]|uniref:IBR finger domain protein n=1 Tax=Lophiotrema nucula TaxID=690887 RepID=A0A6A5YMY4_9PLEO|nr:IBR finger domain protein [Lophiotrema nucula]